MKEELNALCRFCDRSPKRAPKRASKGLPNQPRSSKKHLKLTCGGFLRANVHPRDAQDQPENAQEGPSDGQEVSKNAPERTREAQEHSKGAPMVPRRLLKIHKMSSGHDLRRKLHAKGPKDGSFTIFNASASPAKYI